MPTFGFHSRTAKVLIFFAALLILYLLFRLFFIYTEDAYVKTDTMTVAAQVEGRVSKVMIQDNQPVTQGMPLIQIDPSSLTISQNIAMQNLTQAQRSLPVLKAEIVAAQAMIANEQAHLNFLEKTAHRYKVLYHDGVLPAQTLDDINSQVSMSIATLKKNQADLKTLQESYTQQQASIASLSASLDLANYNLSQTLISAEQTGVITSLNTYVGDYLTVGKPLFTVVNNKNWRIIANVKEYSLQDIHPGQKVLIYLSSHPFHLYWGTVQSIGRGVARSNTPNQALEYIDPTVDWVRYDYRFPVTILFQNAPDQLYMGADTRVWILK